jgi:hypothetical protein
MAAFRMKLLAVWENDEASKTPVSPDSLPLVC